MSTDLWDLKREYWFFSPFENSLKRDSTVFKIIYGDGDTIEYAVWYESHENWNCHKSSYFTLRSIDL